MLIDDVRTKFETAGYRVSHRDDVTEEAAAWFLDYAPATLRNWRLPSSKIVSPPCVRLGSGYHYPIEGLLNWLQRRLRDVA